MGVFALPVAGAASGVAGSPPGALGEAATKGSKGPEGPETAADRAEDAAKADKSKDKKDTDEAGGDVTEGGEGAAANGEAEAGAVGGEAGGGPGAAPGQPLTIHTLNGLLLTLPAAASAAVSGRVGGQRSGGGGGGAPVGDGEQNGGGQRGAGAKGGGAGDQPGSSSSNAPVDQRGASAAVGVAGGASGATRDAGRNAGASAERQQVSAMTGPERSGRARAAQGAERAERVGVAAGVQAEAAAQSGPRESKPPLTVGVGAAGGRTLASGDAGAAASRKSESQRPSVPADRSGPAQVVRGVLAAVNQKGGKVTLDLDPGELGRMKVELKLDARTATATFHVDNPEARRLLEDALPQLRQALTDRGVSLERAEVVAPASSAGELVGAMAAIQAGAQAVAMVVPGMAEQLDVRGERKRSNGDREAGESVGIGRDGADKGESAERAGGDVGGDVRVMTIGPDGVDVTV